MQGESLPSVPKEDAVDTAVGGTFGSMPPTKSAVFDGRTKRRLILTDTCLGVTLDRACGVAMYLPIRTYPVLKFEQK